VTETLQPLPPERKCFRLINGVLVERTVKDVLPALQTNSDGLKQVLDELVKQYKGKQDEMDKWKVRSIATIALSFAHCCYRRRTISRSFKIDHLANMSPILPQQLGGSKPDGSEWLSLRSIKIVSDGPSKCTPRSIVPEGGF
jgi:hypothetical protein